MKSQTLLQEQAEQYLTLSPKCKKEFITEAYYSQNMGYAQIADLVGTYPNRIRRDAKKLGVKPRNRSDAQKLALSSGRHKHPTEGKKRSQETRDKIGDAVSEAYDHLSDEEKARRAEMSKQQWLDMTDQQREEFQKAAAQGIRKTSIHGSKFEHHLLDALLKEGYVVQCHKEHILKNDKLHIDLFLPKLNIAIEVDGPAHLRKVWTEQAFESKKNADNNKTALILSKDLVLIRVQQAGNLTRKFKTTMTKRLLDTIDMIKQKFPDRKDRHIILGEDRGTH